MKLKFILPKYFEKVFIEAFDYFKIIDNKDELNSKMSELFIFLSDLMKNEEQLIEEIKMLETLNFLTPSILIQQQIEFKKYLLECGVNPANDKNWLVTLIDNEILLNKWNSEKELIEVIKNYLTEFDPSEYFDNAKNFRPTNVIDENSINILENLNISIEEMMKEEINNEILKNLWTIDYEVEFLIDISEFEAKSNEEDHIYSYASEYLTCIDRKLLISYSIDDIDGFDIDPLSENLEVQIKKRAFDHFIETSEFEEDLNWLDFIGSVEWKISVVNYSFDDIEQLIK